MTYDDSLAALLNLQGTFENKSPWIRPQYHALDYTLGEASTEKLIQETRFSIVVSETFPSDHGSNI